MVRIPFLRTHSRYREMADAFLDGELRPDETVRFEAHAAGCIECSALLETGKALKASLGTIPVVQAPRSFRITPAMVQERAPSPAPMRATPLLMVARVGAAASVAAFAVVGTLQFSSSSNDGTTAASAPAYEISAAGGAEDDGKNSGDDYSTDADDGEVVPMSTESPQLAPPPSAEVGGAGVAEATPSPEAAPDLMSGNDAGPAQDGDSARSSGDSHAYDTGDAALTTLAAPADEATDYMPWLVVLGGISIVAVAAMGTLELQRRRAW